ncbi:hypothetical protein [Rhizobium leguminosarum]|uniref:hypothetical protein n=1 Tax=Rhizobium leguminosarum TaxID=384 RepID=UPI00102FD7BC|nr:hypothetical protein [Rhizobium leguminosarum]NEI66513.1 hypothetical protein [Rhizobium leguminosarum]TBF89147.1 hypothetical protein ELG82_37010 [Rhizobium leguminosarum]
MRDWLRFGKQAQTEIPPIDGLNQFMVEYRTSNEKDRYALTLWGIVTAFKTIFGGLDGFNFAEPSRRSKYLKMIEDNAAKYAKQGAAIEAKCNIFYMDYLVATAGIPRAEQRGSIEQISDMIDGIIRYGDSRQREIAAIEAAAEEAITVAATFRIGSGFVQGPVTERAVQDVSTIILTDLQQVLRTREDYYWFMIEFHDLLLSEKVAIRSLLDELPLFAIEYEGMRSVDSYVGKPNPGVVYMAGIRPAILDWCRKTIPTLDADQMATRVLGVAYGSFRMRGKQALDAMRLEYAVHYHNNCVSNGSFQSADRWNEVIDALS